MKIDVELSLIHDGESWICRNNSFEVKGRTISELDEELKRDIRESGKYSPGTSINVFMGYDFETIPTWLRQYHSHYFNRILSVNI